MSARCTNTTLPGARLCFQLGQQDRESPAQAVKEESRRVGGEGVSVVEPPGRHPGSDGWRREDTQT